MNPTHWNVGGETCVPRSVLYHESPETRWFICYCSWQYNVERTLTWCMCATSNFSLTLSKCMDSGWLRADLPIDALLRYVFKFFLSAGPVWFKCKLWSSDACANEGLQLLGFEAFVHFLYRRICLIRWLSIRGVQWRLLSVVDKINLHNINVGLSSWYFLFGLCTVSNCCFWFVCFIAPIT